MNTRLLLGFILCVAVGVLLWSMTKLSGYGSRRDTIEGFELSIPGVSLLDMSTKALDAAPTTTEVKNHYKALLLFANADIRASGIQALRLLADFRDRVYGPRDFRQDLKTEDVLASWPAWLPPLDPGTMAEPPPSVTDATNSEVRILSFLQRNFPQESNISEETGSIVRNIIDDFGRRFVFEDHETVELRTDFLKKPLLKDWINPTALPA